MMNEMQLAPPGPFVTQDFPTADPGTTVSLRPDSRHSRSKFFAAYPQVGDVVENCRLVAELGYGASGRAFLAQEIVLASRPVVLKIAAAHDEEHLNLARLQQTHIMPLFWARTLYPEELRVIAMPYLAKT